MERRECVAKNLERCNKQRTSSTEQLKLAVTQIQSLSEQLTAREHELHSIKSSLSWKLTRPLRWIKNFKNLMPALALMRPAGT